MTTILTVGRSKSTHALNKYFLKNKDNLVFTTAKNSSDEEQGANFIDIDPKDVNELKEFALANEINLTVVADNTLFIIDYLTEFSEAGLTIFAPDTDSARIATSKTWGKKFIYKNKIKTPKFAFFEKAIPAIEYARSSNYPIVIKPDLHFETEAPYIAETFIDAKRKIERLFQTDNKKVLIEDYIYGKEATYYVISDGFNPVIMDSLCTFEDELSIKGAHFIDKGTEEKIYSNIILPTISNLAREELEYIGILGFDFIITPEKEIYLIEFNPFFKDLDSEIILEGCDEDMQKLFMGAITGTLTDEIGGPFDFKRGEDFWGAFYEGTNVITTSAKSKAMLKTKLLEEGLNKDLLYRAEKIWGI